LFCATSNHLFHAVEGYPQLPEGSLLRLLDESMEQNHAASRYTKQHPAGSSISQITSGLPKAVAEAPAIGHSQRPAELHFLNVKTDPLPVFGRKTQKPLPNGLTASRVFIEVRWQLLGPVDQELVCQK
jgi:hypothetical protein